MTFAVDDFHDLVRLLGERPDWLAEVRRLVLTQELLNLSAIVLRLSEAQERSESRLEGIEVRIEALSTKVDRLAGEFGNFKGRQLEARLQDAPARELGMAFTHVRSVDQFDLPEDVASTLSRVELDDVRLLDALVSAQPREVPDVGPIWLAVEVSGWIEDRHVARALRRAALLRRAGRRVVPLVAGENIRSDAALSADASHVITVVDRRVEHVAEALATHLR